jgi:DNA-binding SARP family transcriptional activator/tetratricopeptide (TPR) repeat protein
VAVEFRLLGDVEALVDGQPVAVGYAQLRCALAVLLLDTNHTISVDQLVDRIWGNRRLPERPRSALQHNIAVLRKALAGARDVTIAWRSVGYQLTVDPGTVDVHRFRELLDQARAAGDDDHAAALFGQALTLWSGEPFTGLDTPWLDSVRTTLTQEHHEARLDFTDVQLRRGQHTTLLAELAVQSSDHPLDERVASQLMLALYRAGRQADALEHYQEIRRRLAEELGTDPGPSLQKLHHQILTADPALATPGNAGKPRHPPVPRQLPAAPRLFTGRTNELVALTESLNAQAPTGATVLIYAIGGVGGIGKTWLTLHWAHQNLDRFPDGALHVDLRGFGPAAEPVPPATALRGFLSALGIGPDSVPQDLAAQVGLYRSMIAGKRMLIVLDNAADTTQVTPLLPGDPACTVLVTSRRRLAGLVTAHGARMLELDVLTGSEARDLLARHLGENRLAAEPHAVTDLLSYCAGLPLAISIVAAQAASRPDFPLSALADELRDRAFRLDALDTGDTGMSLRAVLSWSYRALPAEAASVFGLLGLAPGPDISLPAVAALAGLPVPQARVLLRELGNAHLVQQHAPSRYLMHDLVRLYAADQARDDQPAAPRATALRRLTDFYLHTAIVGDQLLYPHRDPVPVEDRAEDCHPLPLADEAAVMTWFAAEHSNLLAVQQSTAEQGWHAPVWQLAWALDTFHRRQGRIDDPLMMWRAGLAAARQLGDPAAQITAHRRLGNAYSRKGLLTEAVDQLGQALSLAERTGDLLAQAHSHYFVAITWSRLADGPRALEHATRALRLFRTLDMPVWEANALNQMGWHEAQLGRHSQARTHCQAALALFRRFRDRDGEANALDSLGYIAQRSGQHTLALDYFQQALAILCDLGDAYEEASTLDRLAQAQHALGQREQARATWEKAFGIYHAQHRDDEASWVRQQLDLLLTTTATTPQ